MTTGALRDRARALGIEPSYDDVDDVTRAASPATLAALVDLLDDGRERGSPTSAVDRTGSAPPPFDRVVVVRGGRWHSGVAPSFPGPVRVSVELDDGGTADAVTVSSPAELGQALPGDTLPLGLHTLEWRAAGAQHRSTLLVAPRRFPVPTRPAPGLALFAPAYALWSHDEPLPSYEGLARLGEATATFGVDTIATLPLYAPGFGDRFDPSPYSPLSRFHWNELLVPDRGPAPATAPSPAVVTVDDTTVDWMMVERSRRDRLDAAEPTPVERERHLGWLETRPDVTAFARWAGGDDPVAVRRHELGQWLAERALDDVAARLRAAGQALALDLPVGARGESWETHTWPHLFVRGASVGAPPDTFFSDGQDWGLPPLSPVASRADGHRVWYELLRRACRFADVVRIDHVMQVFRLWWVPEGHPAHDGAYVRYPADELLAVAATVAATTGTVMVGEDLGTVSPEVSTALADWGLIGMHEEAFTIHALTADPHAAGPHAADHDAPDPPSLPPVPAGTWAGVRTHDMAPLAATIAEVDTGPYARALSAELGRPVTAEPAALLRAMIQRLRRSGVHEIVVDLDDAFGVVAPHNVPGLRSDANWSRRYGVPVEQLATDPRLIATLRPHPASADPRARGGT